jgi:ABC-type multidrug transport system fused ATPase/permease subunit
MNLEGGTVPDSVAGDLEIGDVHFTYPTRPDSPALRGVSLRIPHGEVLALVGASGSGKSTIARLLARLYDPDRGWVRLDGHDLRDLDPAWLRRQVSLVPAEAALFARTVEENILFGRRDASHADVERATQHASATDFIRDLSEGYQTDAGDQGRLLSGGQRQRIAIARAILADPTILILDEATSSLDSESEAKIQDGLGRLRQGRTTFVIAHRLSTIRSADQILVLEGGEIVERGTHDQLLATGGRYRQLHDRQYALEYNRFVNPGEDEVPEAEPVVLERPAAGGIPRNL